VAIAGRPRPAVMVLAILLLACGNWEGAVERKGGGGVGKESDVFVPCGTFNYCTQRTGRVQKHHIDILDECVSEVLCCEERRACVENGPSDHTHTHTHTLLFSCTKQEQNRHP